MRAKRALVLHECLPQLQQLSVLLGVHPPQVLDVLDHHLHRLADAVLLQGRVGFMGRKVWGLCHDACHVRGTVEVVMVERIGIPDGSHQASPSGWTPWSWTE